MGASHPRRRIEATGSPSPNGREAISLSEAFSFDLLRRIASEKSCGWRGLLPLWHSAPAAASCLPNRDWSRSCAAVSRGRCAAAGHRRRRGSRRGRRRCVLRDHSLSLCEDRGGDEAFLCCLAPRPIPRRLDPATLQYRSPAARCISWGSSNKKKVLPDLWRLGTIAPLEISEFRFAAIWRHRARS